MIGRNMQKQIAVSATPRRSVKCELPSGVTVDLERMFRGRIDDIIAFLFDVTIMIISFFATPYKRCDSSKESRSSAQTNCIVAGMFIDSNLKKSLRHL